MTLSEIREDKYCVISYTWNLQKIPKFIEIEGSMVTTWACGRGRWGDAGQRLVSLQL